MHKCKRFRTALKRNGIRMMVACRECGKRKSLIAVAGPVGKLP